VKNTHSTHARRAEKHNNQFALLSEEQPQSESSRTAMHSEAMVHTKASAPTESTQLTPIDERSTVDPRLSEEGGHTQHAENTETIREIPDEPQNEPEQSFATAPASFTPSRGPISHGPYTSMTESRSPTPERRQDTGKQRATYEFSRGESSGAQSSDWSVESQSAREFHAMKAIMRKWADHARDTAQELRALRMEQEILQERFADSQDSADRSNQLFQELYQQLHRMAPPSANVEVHPASPRAQAGAPIYTEHESDERSAQSNWRSPAQRQPTLGEIPYAS
jgi:hypothetical protein